MSRKAQPRAPDPREVAWRAGLDVLSAHGLFRSFAEVRFLDVPRLAQDRGYARVTSAGIIECHQSARLDPDEWAWVVAHLMLHRGLGHLEQDHRSDAAGRAVDCLECNRFLRESRLGREPFHLPEELPRGDPTALADRWRVEGIPPSLEGKGTAGYGPDILPPDRTFVAGTDWRAGFAVDIARAAAHAVEVAGGARTSMMDPERRRTVWDLARRWFISSYPLLGGLAAQFTIVADAELARAWHISIAAVNASVAEIYVNPLAGLTGAEWRFVLAHEMLHAALRHGERVGGRDPYLWNIAADFVINDWLMQMNVGDMPDGVLFDQSLRGESAESAYDRIAGDLRRLRKLATLRGRGQADILDHPLPHRDGRGPTDLDDFYRRALCTGLAYHEAGGRGLLPSGLVEEIRALDQPPLPWDAQLGRWFQEYVPMPQRRRSYARPSRRQASTPDIPRPGWLLPDEEVTRCTFGVVIDTSGSMSHELLGKALGAIASYATARDVPRARVVFGDAAAYDAGYLSVDDIVGRVKVRGRGGTILQPSIDLLDRADDFPPTAPILVITDGYCDVLRIRREHAYLIPETARLPFTPRGPVFRMA
jgi:predicted metal-dependent peptidase